MSHAVCKFAVWLRPEGGLWGTNTGTSVEICYRYTYFHDSQGLEAENYAHESLRIRNQEEYIDWLTDWLTAALLLSLVCAVILGFETYRTRDQITFWWLWEPSDCLTLNESAGEDQQQCDQPTDWPRQLTTKDGEAQEASILIHYLGSNSVASCSRQFFLTLPSSLWGKKGDLFLPSVHHTKVNWLYVRVGNTQWLSHTNKLVFIIIQISQLNNLNRALILTARRSTE
jgi:hypothetical protein